MTPPASEGTTRGAIELDALLDMLSAERAGLPATAGDVALDSGLVATARLLVGVLPRFHPSFAHEERLARRLRRAADGLASEPSPGTIDAAVVRLPNIGPGPQDGPPGRGRARRIWISIASGVSIALSVAGAAFLMWRRTHGSERLEPLA